MRKNYFPIHLALAFLLSFFCQLDVFAQQPKKLPATPVICPAKFQDMNTRVNIPPERSKGLQQRMQNVATAEIQVTYGPGAQANPEAQAAFQFALDIWATQIVSPVPIKIFADFADLGPGVLASAGPAYNVSGVPGAPDPDVLYPAALANAIAGETLFPDENFDLIVNLGNGIPWYFGTDGNTPSGLFDFVTVALHEAGHGLGFTTVRGFNNGVGTLRSNGLPSIFGVFIEDGDGTSLLDFPDPSTELGDAFTGGDIFMGGTFAVAALAGMRPELYAPSNWQGGSSLAHWDEAAFPAGDVNSLMTPQVGTAESNFDIGDITRGLFKDMGWVINDAEAPPLLVSPNSIDEELFVGDTIRRTITISNIADVSITATAAANAGNTTIELIQPQQLTIPSASSDSLEIKLNTAGLLKGVYNDTLFITAPELVEAIAVPVEVRVLDGTETPFLVVTPNSFEETIQQLQIVSRDLVIENTGDADLNFNITVNDEPPMEFAEKVALSNKAVTKAGKSKKQFTNLSAKTSGIASLVKTQNNDFTEVITSLYATDFEEFTPGNLNGQLGWASQYADNWIISTENSFEGNQHFRGVSDGLGGTRPGSILALSPSISPADEPFMVLSAQINIQGSGTTWEVIPQSPTAGSVVTRLRFNADGTIDVLTDPNFVQIEASIPSGYFELRIIVDKDDATFSIYFDDELVFSGQGFAPIIEQAVFLSAMEETGSTFDVDNLEITDGDPNAFFVSVAPNAGVVPPGSSQTVQVKFDARAIDPGNYEASLTVNSNDSVNSPVDIPVSLTVLQPPTIGVNPDSLSASVNVQTDMPPVKTETFSISNSGESDLDFTTSLGPLQFDSPSAPTDLLLSNLDLARYGEGNAGPFKEKSRGVIEKSSVPSVQILDNATFQDSIFYDSGIPFPDNFAGVQTSAYTSAVKFDAENEFTLTAVRNGYRTETVTDAPVILEIYRGGDTPNDGELLLTQTFNQTSEEGILVAEELSESLTFTAGESFWVVHKYPDGIEFPQGVDNDATQRPNTYFFSGDGGATYNPSGFVFFVRALSGASEESYITLEPSEGTISPGQSVDVTVTFNGENLANGTYNRDILVASNDPVTPEASVATTFEVAGQVSEIALSEEFILFNDVFIGAERERSFTIINNGLAELNVSNIASDNADFSVDPTSATIAASDSLEVKVLFTPSEAGNINGIITIESDADNTQTLEVVVNGVGVEPPIAVLDPQEVMLTTDAGTTIDTEITLKNDGKAPLIFSFPDLAVAAALADPNVKLNDTKRINFESFSLQQEKGFKDNRQGASVDYSVGTDNGFGYTWIDSDEPGGPVFNFEDITAVGTEITTDLGGDGSTEVAISFPFEFYGQTNASVIINANGFVTFEDPSGLTYVNTQIPTEDGINAVIAAFWNDLEPQNDNGSVHYFDDGSKFVVQWTQAPIFFGEVDETVTFQIVLFPDGNIDFYYEDVETAPFRNTATVGIENFDGTDGAQVAFNTEYIKDDLAIRFVKPSIFFTDLISNVSPLSGVVPAGGSKQLSVTLDATELNDGVYFDELMVSSNAPSDSLNSALFELTVIGFPEISVTPDTLQYDPIFVGLESEANFLLENTGSKDLEITSISNETSDFILDTIAPITLAPDETLQIGVTFKPSSVGFIEDKIIIESNDAFGMETAIVYLFGEGVDPPVIEVTPDSLNLEVVREQEITETVTISNTGNSTLNYALSPPFFGKAGEANQKVATYEKLEYAKIRSKEALDTRVGPSPLNASGGPGTFGYTWVDNNSGGPAYDFMDISESGEVANVGADDEETVALPFPFKFFGEEQDSVTIGANGFLTFAEITGSNFINTQIPDPANPNMLIAGLWDDLEPQNGTGVFYMGTSEYFIVQYEAVPGFGFPPFLPVPDPVTFQVILFPDGSIKMQYENVNSTIRTSSTVGLEGPGGLSGLQVIFNTEFLTDGLAITFTPPISGTVEPGETAEVPITFSAEGLEANTSFTGDIVVSSNDPIRSEINIPVTLDVLDAPEVVSFTLINADTNEEIGSLEEGDVINLDDYTANAFSVVANIGDLPVGSVIFDFNEKENFQKENIAPYALDGDKKNGTEFIPVAFPLGDNTITATPYSGKNGSGMMGIPLTVSFEVTQSPLMVSSFTLFNAETDEEIGTLENGTVINLDDYDANAFSIVANATAIGTQSVVFDFNGKTNFQKENVIPYALKGDKNNGTDLNAVEFPLGTNYVTATPYDQKNGKGKAGIPLSVIFEVTSSSAQSIADLPNADSPEKFTINIYPNPVRSEASYQLVGKAVLSEGYLYNLSGILVSSFKVEASNQGRIDMSRFPAGVYLLRLVDKKGKMVAQTKIVKK
ncbi:Ig-like domain-containing protein [Galbibacter mesophilus]|uniref:Ig-like domain-containing protein n=1 Tax=Galbibacter mesophilus TaxID=379069 RepID=UPI00191DB86F|nr:choice-of-anchor D domain-containing protein [Galbibacter mesophilus]MCM5662799.1 choice-of-anchor D domain-containing protein [Galbibacter mesophilus]